MSAIARSRIELLVGNALSSDSQRWHKSKERLTGLEDSRFGDRSYHVRSSRRNFHGPVQGNQQQTTVTITVELGRFLAGGTALGYDIQSLRDSLDNAAYSVSIALERPANWDYSNTGIVIVNHVDGEEVSHEDLSERSIVHEISYDVIVRSPPG